MDEQRFDDLVRHVATTPRRHVLRTLLGGLAVGLGLPAVTTANRKPDTKHDKRHNQKPDQDAKASAKKRRTVTTEGPCGNGSGKANACEKDRDCCTRLCDQKRGRCRCKKLGEGCKDDRNCCAQFGQPMSCQSGRCQTVSQDQTPLPPTCTPTTCAAQGKNCGTIPDGCDGTIPCGTCTVAGETCGGSGTPNRCGCSASSCAAGQVCQDGACTCTPASCPDGCCDGGMCRTPENAACGRGGGSCAACTAPATCQQGVCSIYPTYGCTLQDDSCAEGGNVVCPDNPGVNNPPDSFPNLCLIAASGYPVCSSFGGQSTCTSDAQCPNPAIPVCVVAHGACTATACRNIAPPPV